MSSRLSKFSPRRAASTRSAFRSLFTVGLTAGASLLSLAAHSHAAGIWDGGTGDYNVATNWDNDQVPGAINVDVSNNGTAQITTDHTTNDILSGTNSTSTISNWTQTAGTVTQGAGNGWFRLGTVAGGVGTYNLAGGTLNLFNGGTTGQAQFTIGEVITNTGTLGSGFMNITGGVLNNNVAGNQLHIGGGSGNQVNNTNGNDVGNGTLNLSGTGVINNAGELWLGENVGSTGVMNMSGGTVNQNSWFAVGRGGATGTLNLSGGTFNKGGGNGVHVTVVGGNSFINQTGGTFNNPAGQGSIWIGENTVGNYLISGGTLIAGDGIEVGRNGNSTGVLTIGGTAVVTTANIILGTNTGTITSTVNLNGGTLNLNAFAVGASTAGAKTINLNGTQLNELANSATFLGGAGVVANVQAGGLRLNSNGFAATIATALLHSGAGTDGGLIKSGTGALTLTGANTFTGNIAVNGGILDGLLGGAGNPTSLPGYNTAGRISVASGATLGFGVGATNQFSFADVDAARGTATTAGTVAFAAGARFGIDTANSPSVTSTYGSTITDNVNGAMGFAKFGANTLILSGNNTYTGNTIVYGGVLQASANNPNAFGNPPATSRIVLNGGSLDVNGNSITRSGLSLNGGSLASTLGTAAAPTIVNLGAAPTAAQGVIEVGSFVGNVYTVAAPAATAGVQLNLTGTGGTAFSDPTTPGIADIVKRVNIGNPNIAAAVNLGTATRYIAVVDTGGDAAPELTFSGPISGSGGIVLDNRQTGEVTPQEFGSLAFTAANTYTGITSVNFGRLEITNTTFDGNTPKNFVAGSLGAIGFANRTQVTNNGTLAIGGSGLLPDGLNITESLYFQSTQSVNYGGDALQNFGVANGIGNTISGPVAFGDSTQINVASGRLTISSNILAQDTFGGDVATSTLFKTGGGSLVLSGDNTISGVILRAVDNSEVVVGNNGGLGGGNAIQSQVLNGGRIVLGIAGTAPVSVTLPTQSGDLLITGSGGTGNLAGALQAAAGTADTFGGTVTLNPIGATNARLGAGINGTLTISGAVQEQAVAAFEISGLINPTAGQPDGTVKLMGNNTYTGVTSVIRGNLVLSTLAANASKQSVNNNANLLIGTSNTAGERASLTIQDNAIVTNNNDTVGALVNRGATYIAYGTAATNGGAIPATTFTIASGALNTQSFVTGTSFTNGPVTTATYNQTGGTVSVDRFFSFGSSGTGTNTANISAGTVNVKANAASTDGEFEVGVFNAQSATVNISGTAAILLDRNSNLVLGSQSTSGNNTVTQSGASTITFYGDGGTTVGGTGGLILGRASSSGVNTYNLNGGTLTVPTISRPATTTTGSGVFNFNGGTLNAAVNTATFINGLTTASVQAGGAIINTASLTNPPVGLSVTIPQALVHNAALGATADGGLTKNGIGTLTLSGVNTYTGNTIISPVAGSTLALSGAGSIANSPVVSVGAGAIFDVSAVTGGFAFANTQRLVGGGTVNGAFSVNGGTISPGPVPTGIGTARLTLSSTVTLNTNSTVALEINGATAGTNYDQLTVGGAVTIGSNVTLSLSLGNGFTPLANQVLTLIDESNAATAIAGTFANVPNSSTVTLTNNTGSYNFAVNYSGGTGNDLTLTLVPEPSTWTAMLTGLGLLGMWQRLRRQRARSARATV